MKEQLLSKLSITDIEELTQHFKHLDFRVEFDDWCKDLTFLAWLLAKNIFNVGMDKNESKVFMASFNLNLESEDPMFETIDSICNYYQLDKFNTMMKSVNIS